MEAGFVYYLSDKNIEVDKARRQRDAAQGIVRSRSGSTTTSSPPSPLSPSSPRSNSSTSLRPPRRKDSAVGRSTKMDLYVGSGSFIGGTAAFPITKREEAEPDELFLQSTPLEIRDGRPYLRNMPYFLPCDLAELHRQSLRTMLSDTVLSGPTSASFASGLPKRVLEVGCGNGFWSSTCHDHFKSLGHDCVSFTGVDLVPLAPNLQEQGVDWTFVQHDLRKFPWPFLSGEFDYIMAKDISLAIPLDVLQRFMDECVRVLSEDGTLEIRESDHLLRCLVSQSHLSPPDAATKTYQIAPGMAFGPAQNKFIRDANSWVEEACEQRKLPPTPCARMAEMLFQEPDLLYNVSSRRIAIPLMELAWEQSADGRKRSCSRLRKQDNNKGKGKATRPLLNADQAAVRHTALMTVIQKIEGLEPVLKECSGKTSEEWASWWANMMSSLLEQKGAAAGECLEIGAWWATKRHRSR